MKDAYYFPHDTNAINDPKLMMLLAKCGVAGIGIYWIIIEIMHQQETGKITIAAFEQYLKLYCSFDQSKGSTFVEQIQQVLTDVDLFVIENGYVTSKRVLRNKELRTELSKKRSLAGKISAQNRQVLNKNKHLSTHDEQGKEIKRNENKTTQFVISHMQNSDFLKDWNDFLEMRVKIRRPATKRAQEAILKKLSVFDLVTARKILEQSIVNSWQDVFPLKTNSQPQSFNQPKQNVPSVDKTQEYLRSLET